jgi:hypothetical protein
MSGAPTSNKALNLSPNLTGFGRMGSAFNANNPANLPPPVMQNIPMQQLTYQTSMPSFEQLVGGGYNPMASIAAMQRQAVSIPQNPFFGGAIPMDFGIPVGAMPMPSPRYSAGQANRAFEQQQAAERAARDAQAAAEAQAAMQLQAIYNPTPWTHGSYFDSPSTYNYADAYNPASFHNLGFDALSAYQVPTYDSTLGYGNN